MHIEFSFFRNLTPGHYGEIVCPIYLSQIGRGEIFALSFHMRGGLEAVDEGDYGVGFGGG